MSQIVLSSRLSSEFFSSPHFQRIDGATEHGFFADGRRTSREVFVVTAFRTTKHRSEHRHIESMTRSSASKGNSFQRLFHLFQANSPCSIIHISTCMSSYYCYKSLILATFIKSDAKTEDILLDRRHAIECILPHITPYGGRKFSIIHTT